MTQHRQLLFPMKWQRTQYQALWRTQPCRRTRRRFRSNPSQLSTRRLRCPRSEVSPAIPGPPWAPHRHPPPELRHRVPHWPQAVHLQWPHSPPGLPQPPNSPSSNRPGPHLPWTLPRILSALSPGRRRQRLRRWPLCAQFLYPSRSHSHRRPPDGPLPQQLPRGHGHNSSSRTHRHPRHQGRRQQRLRRRSVRRPLGVRSHASSAPPSAAPAAMPCQPGMCATRRTAQTTTRTLCRPSAIGLHLRVYRGVTVTVAGSSPPHAVCSICGSAAQEGAARGSRRCS